jgi:hypothetical protein
MVRADMVGRGGTGEPAARTASIVVVVVENTSDIVVEVMDDAEATEEGPVEAASWRWRLIIWSRSTGLATAAVVSSQFSSTAVRVVAEATLLALSYTLLRVFAAFSVLSSSFKL